MFKGYYAGMKRAVLNDARHYRKYHTGKDIPAFNGEKKESMQRPRRFIGKGRNK